MTAALFMTAALASCSDILDDADGGKTDGMELKFITRTGVAATKGETQTRVSTEERYDERWGWFTNEDSWEPGDRIGISAWGDGVNCNDVPFRTDGWSSGYVLFLPEGENITVPSGSIGNVSFTAYYPYGEGYRQFNLAEDQFDPLLEQLRTAECWSASGNTVELQFRHVFPKIILRTYSDPVSDFDGNQVETMPLDISATITRQRTEADFYPGSNSLNYNYEQPLKTIPFTAKSGFRDSLYTYEAFVLPQYYGYEVEKDSMPEIRYTLYGMMTCKAKLKKYDFGNLNIFSGNAYEMRLAVPSDPIWKADVENNSMRLRMFMPVTEYALDKKLEGKDVFINIELENGNGNGGSSYTIPFWMNSGTWEDYATDLVDGATYWFELFYVDDNGSQETLYTSSKHKYRTVGCNLAEGRWMVTEQIGNYETRGYEMYVQYLNEGTKGEMADIFIQNAYNDGVDDAKFKNEVICDGRNITITKTGQEYRYEWSGTIRIPMDARYVKGKMTRCHNDNGTWVEDYRHDFIMEWNRDKWW